jgi:MoxR-like ATPase
VFRHRVLVNFRAEAEGIDADAVTTKLLASVREPQSPMR